MHTIHLNHQEWLANEYQKWIEALQSSTVHNFKDHPMVQRMLGEIEWEAALPAIGDIGLLTKIDNIGRSRPSGISGTCLRMLYYADQVLQQNPKSIVEIGGGVGQFYAVLRVLGYKRDYYIFDLQEVKEFQNAYLTAVENQTGLSLSQRLNFDFCVSFYALGEFDDETKDWYIESVVKKCPHGFMIWNPHSGASENISFECTVADENPLLHPGNKQLTW